MGHIKEPDGVDFIIESPPLTDKEREKISEFIRKQKIKAKNRKIKSIQKGKDKVI